jgi:2-keto-4-pentenoate hydratase
MIDRVYLSMEIIDMRVAGGKIALIDTVSDNAFSCMMVIGEGLSASKELFQALPTMELKLNKDGVEVASGPASAVLGDPLLSVQWVVNRMGKLGRDVEAGEVILTGAVHASVALTPGSTWSVTSEAFAPVIITT